MSFVLTPESLQDISVKCVTAFITKQASLSEAVANESKNLELNPEQIKRVIETSNTLAYLRQLKDAPDRSFEFPVADYNQVMGSMAMPSQSAAPTVVIVKQASQGSFEKIASFEAEGEVPVQEKRALLMKQAMVCKETLSKMAEVKEDLKQRLEKAAALLSKDALGLEKLAQVVEEEDFSKLLHLCHLEKRAEVNSVFLDKDLNPARQVYSLYKEATDLVKTESEMTSFVKEAERILFEKESGVVSGLFKGVGYAVGKTVKGVTSGVRDALDPKGFGATGKRMGFKSTDDAVKGFDKLKAEKGTTAALDRFSGHKPNFLLHRVGVGGAMTATAGMGMEHNNNVWKDLNG